VDYSVSQATLFLMESTARYHHSRVTRGIGSIFLNRINTEGNIIQILAPYFNYSDMQKGYENFQQHGATTHIVKIQWLPYINNFGDQI
jgi:hypothetical protein